MGLTRVLVADDNLVYGSTLSRFVSSQPDMEVIGVAASGGEAVQLASLLCPDVVLMDLCMPGLDGFDAMRILTDTNGRMAVIALTAHCATDSEERSRAAGARAFLCKAEVDGRLLELIRSLPSDGRSAT